MTVFIRLLWSPVPLVTAARIGELLTRQMTALLSRLLTRLLATH